MGLLLVFAIFLSAGLKADASKYGVRQHLAENIYKFFRWVANDQIGAKGKYFIPLLGSIFLFIIMSYYAGLLPWKLGSVFEWWPTLPLEPGQEHAHAWHGASPCADLNIPAAIAAIVIVVYVAAGVFIGGFDYIQIYLPINFTKSGIKLNLMCLIELLDLVVRPLTLTLRLFANTWAGEILLGTFISLVAVLIPALILGFEVFVGVLQAFLFMILTSVYIGITVQHAEHASHGEH